MILLVHTNIEQPAEEFPLYRVWYDPICFELKTVTWGHAVYNHKTAHFFDTYNIHDFVIGESFPDEFLVEPSTRLIYHKPVFSLSVDKSKCLGDGKEFFTIKVELPDNTPFTAVIKDISQKAQTSSGTVDSSNPFFKVRAFSRCTARIRVKEVFDGKVYDADGNPFFNYGRGYIELNFTNPGFD